MRHVWIAGVAVVAASLYACGGSTIDSPAPAPADTAGDDAGAPDDTPVVVVDAGADVEKRTPHAPTFPQAATKGGNVVKSPKFQPIVFTGETLTADIDAFAKKLGSTTYWTEQAGEYGVGPAVGRDTVTFAETPPAAINNEQIKTWLQGKLGTAGGPLGTPDPDTLYAIYYPKATVISFADGSGSSCSSFGGYHEETDVGGVKVGVAVIPRCGGGSRDRLTSVSSHEFFEWATDPFPFTDTAWSRMRPQDFAWALMGGAELSDLCTAIDYMPINPGDLGYVVQTQWSNKAAAAGKHPCAPGHPEAYFTAFPDATDTTKIPYTQGETVSAKTIKVKPGTTRTVDVTLYSSDPTDTTPWDISVQENDRFTQGTASGYTYDLDLVSGKAGDVARLTITATSKAQFSVFTIISRRGRSLNMWPGIVSAN